MGTVLRKSCPNLTYPRVLLEAWAQWPVLQGYEVSGTEFLAGQGRRGTVLLVVLIFPFQMSRPVRGHVVTASGLHLSRKLHRRDWSGLLHSWEKVRSCSLLWKSPSGAMQSWEHCHLCFSGNRPFGRMAELTADIQPLGTGAAIQVAKAPQCPSVVGKWSQANPCSSRTSSGTLESSIAQKSRGNILLHGRPLGPCSRAVILFVFFFFFKFVFWLDP